MKAIKLKELTKNELKQIKGGMMAGLAGDDHTHTCSCDNHPGTWTGNYGSQDRADASLNTWCEDGKGKCEAL